MKRLAAIAALVLTLAPQIVAAPAVIDLKAPSGKTFHTELMVSDADRQMGLMFRPSLAADGALLFVFERPDFHGIWMKNCKFPIDIVWLDEQKKVIDVAEAVPPCRTEPCTVYSPMRKAAYVVEMNAKQARQEKMVVGAALAFDLPQGAAR